MRLLVFGLCCLDLPKGLEKGKLNFEVTEYLQLRAPSPKI